MRNLALLLLFVVSPWVTTAAETTTEARRPPAAKSSPESKTQRGQRATVSLLAVGRVSSKEAPGGMRFLFLVKRAEGVTGQFTLKETRDFLVDGASYQEKTQAELGKKFEPTTTFDTAENFFAKQPNMRRLGPDDITGAFILTVAIGGGTLEPGAKVSLTLHVGFEKEVEPFTFRATVPPAGPNPKKN